MSARHLTLALALLGAAGCTAKRVPPVTAGAFAPERDERVLWAEAEGLQEAVEKAGALDPDAGLQRYVDGVAQRLVPASARGVLPVKAQVLADPHLNAFALPNGGIFVTTGLLARMENEAQLATVLAHEVVHALNRHALVEYRTFKNSAAVSAAIPGAGVLGLGTLGTKAAVTGYSRDLEREADAQGFALLKAAGYDVAQAPAVFRHLEAGLEGEDDDEPFFFGSHPRLKDRLASYQRLAQGAAAGGEVHAPRYEAAVREALLRNARQDLVAGRFAAAERVAGRYVAQRPRVAAGWAVLGDAALQAGGKGAEGRALEHYRKAVALDAACAEGQRGLGRVLAHRGEREAARAALRKYLQLRPAAEDRGWVEADLKALEGGK